MGILNADVERLRKGMDELARKLSKTEGLLEREKDALSYEKQEKEKIQKEVKQAQEEKEAIAKEEKTQRRYKEILAISAFVGIIIFNSLR